MKRQCSHVLGFILYDCVLHFQTVISVFPNQHKLEPAGFRGRGTGSSSFMFSPHVQPPLGLVCFNYYSDKRQKRFITSVAQSVL